MVEVEEVKLVGITRVTQTFGKKTKTLNGPSKEGGSFHAKQGWQIMPVTCNYVGKGKLPQLGNSPTPNSMTTEACSS